MRAPVQVPAEAWTVSLFAAKAWWLVNLWGEQRKDPLTEGTPITPSNILIGSQIHSVRTMTGAFS